LDKEDDEYGNKGIANKLLQEDPVRPDLYYVDSSLEEGIVNLGSDHTAPFGIKNMGKEGGVQFELYQRFEFAYYNW
jgi:hypothetical protein